MTALVRVADPPARAGVQLPSARGWIDLLAPAAELARTIAPTDFVPRNYRNNPPAITAAILYGDEIGLGPLVAVNQIFVIEGRVFIAAEAQRALVLRAGHEIVLEESTSVRACWAGVRAGGQKVTRIVWTMDRARRARLDGKPNWRSYPEQMLSARASAELCRAIFADAIHGLGAIEEYDGDDGLDGATSSAATPAPRTTRSRRRAVAAAVVAPDPGPGTAPELPPLPGETDVAAVDLADATRDDEQAAQLIEPRQLRRLQSLMRTRGIGDRADRLALACEIIGRTVTTSKELTEIEADRVIDYLEHLEPAPPYAHDETEQAPAPPDEPGTLPV